MLDISLHTIAIYQNYLYLEHKYFRFYYTILEHVRNCVQRIRCTLSNCQFDITKVRFQKKNKKQAFQQKIETSHKKMAFPKITLNARNMKHIYSSHWIKNNNKNKKRNITQIHCPYCLHLCCQMVNPILLPFYFYRTCKSDFFSIEF